MQSSIASKKSSSPTSPKKVRQASTSTSLSSLIFNQNTTILISCLLRIFIILYASQHENISKQQLTITDIDYKVYTDAASYESPYMRHTYRYTPLLAYMMSWNYTVADYAGKLFFVAFDALAMMALSMMYSSRKWERGSFRQVVVALYGYNPLFVHLTIRGSCQSISLAFMFWSFYFIFGKYGAGNTVSDNTDHRFSKYAKNNKNNKQDNRKYVWLGYILYGLWVHFRVYPIILLPILLIHEYKLSKQQSNTSFLIKFIKISIFSGTPFILLLLYFYRLYGYPFLHQTYLYHLTRLDNRHSFSPIFYEIYLNMNSQSFLRSMAQFCVIFAISRKMYNKISFYYAHFLITYAFVSFNKVITMQYYMWIFGSLLLVLPESTLTTNSHRRYQKIFSYVMQFLLGILLWVWSSIKLEKEGENQFNLMWFICIGKLFSDYWAVSGFMSTVKNKLSEYKQDQGYQRIHDKEKQQVISETVLITNKSSNKSNINQNSKN